ncbi:hypothetical protein SDJN03_18725, partial [Cucurbita argyrosperma subsp. sororia]
MPIRISGKEDSMFPTEPFDFNIFKKDCKALYGVSPNRSTYLRRIARLCMGFHQIVVGSQLSMEAKVLHNISESIIAIPTAEGSHCLDLEEGREDDLEWLTSQRKAEMDIIDTWISKYYVDLLQSNQTLDAH